MLSFIKRAVKTPSNIEGSSTEKPKQPLTPRERKKLQNNRPNTQYRSLEVQEEERHVEKLKKEREAVKVIRPETIKDTTVIDNSIIELEESVASIIGKKHSELKYEDILRYTITLFHNYKKMESFVEKLKLQRNNRFMTYNSETDYAPSWN
jgi:hypothetical protein